MSTLRVSGLASGMSTDDVIKAMCSNRQTEIDNLTAKITNEETQYAHWEQINTYMTMLQTDAQNLCNYSNWAQKSVEATDSTVLSGTADDTASTGSYTVKITQLATSSQCISNSQASVSSALGYSGSFTVNGQSISVTSTDSLTNIVAKINAKTSSMTTGVKAYLLGGIMVLETSNSGAANTITTATTSGDDVLTNLGMNISSHKTSGVDLTGSINGVAITSSSNTLTKISGVTLNVTDTGTTTVKITHDTDTIKSLLKTFISDYNTVMTYLGEESAIGISSSSGALTGVKGDMAGDISVMKLYSKSRQSITSLFPGTNSSDPTMNSLRAIGIWTSGTDNKLSIVDEDKLDNALSNNFDAVKDMLRAYGNTTTGKGTGIMRSFYTYMSDVTDTTTGVISLKEGTLSNRVSNDQDRLAQKKSSLAEYQAELYKHYAAMEKMVANYNSQGSYLSSLSSSSS